MTNFQRWMLYTRDLESPDIYLRWGFIHLICSALQRRVWFTSDPKTQLPCGASLFLNFFNVLIGPPATGKGRVIKSVITAISDKKLTRTLENGKIIPLIQRSPEKVTCEALIDAVSQSEAAFEFKVEEEGKIQKRACIHSSTSFNIEELEVLYSKNAHDMVQLLNQFYDAGDLRYETRGHGKFDVKNVCVNMLSGTTPDAIKDLMTERVIATGHTSRMVMIYADKPRFYRSIRDITLEQQNAMDDLVMHLKELCTKVAGEIRLSPEAQKYFDGIYESGEMMEKRINKDPKLDHYYGRKKVHWLKLSAALHFAERTDTNIIQLPSVEEAYNTLNETELRMQESYKANNRNQLYDISVKIQRYVEERKEVRYKRLMMDFYYEGSKNELHEVLEMMLEFGQLVNVNQQTQALERAIFTVGKNGKAT